MIKEEVLDSFNGQNVLVTSGTGLIGREIVRILCDAGAHVKIVSLDHLEVDPRADHVYGDLRDFALCRTWTQDMDFVFHVAGIKGSIEVTKSKPASFFVPLLMFNTNMLEACRLNKVRKVVYTSSIGAYSSAEVFRETENMDGPPMDLFPGWAKRMAEMQIDAYRIQYGVENFAIVWPSNVYGPGDNFDPANAMVIQLSCRAFIGRKIPLSSGGDGSAIRDFVYSRDVAEGVILALHHGTKGGFVNLGSGTGHTIRELVEALHSFLDFNSVFDREKPAGFPKRVMDIGLAEQLIDYNPTTSLEEGLQATWDWFVNNQDEYLRKQNYF